MEVTRSGCVLDVRQVGLLGLPEGCDGVESKEGSRGMARAGGIMEVPFAEMGKAGEEVLVRTKSWFVCAGYEVAGAMQEEKSAWRLAAAQASVGCSFLICEMGKVFALLRILEIK